jgi:hypothetical protein
VQQNLEDTGVNLDLGSVAAADMEDRADISAVAQAFADQAERQASDSLCNSWPVLDKEVSVL